MIKLTCQDNCESEITVQLPPIGGGWATYSCPNCGNSHELLGDEETGQAYAAMNILTKYAPNGELITLGGDDRYTDGLGNYGYRGHFTGAWICYTDGAYCACNEGEGE